MSTPTMQPTPEAKPTQATPRTRIRPIGGNGKSLYAMLIGSGLSVIGALGAHFYAKGGTVSVSCNAPGANIQLAGSSSVAGPSGSVTFEQVPYGTPSVQINHPDYEPFSTDVSAGWFSSRNFSFRLTPVPLALRINTAAGATVLLNGQMAGTANDQGFFYKEGVLPGDYDIEVKLAGYYPAHIKRHLSPKVENLWAPLNITPARAQQAQQEQQRAQQNAMRAQQLLGRARQLFNSRQYKPALASVDEVLRIEPGNYQAQQLKSQIVQTMNLLR